MTSTKINDESSANQNKKNIKNSNAIVVISDLHVGSIYGLCGDRVVLDGGGIYRPNKIQKEIFKIWNGFWEFVNDETSNSDGFDIVINGDLIEGYHHDIKCIWSSNIADQISAFVDLFYEIFKNNKNLKSKLKDIHIVRGTESHAGKSCEFEEILRKILNEKFSKNENTVKISEYELFLKFGKSETLCHFSHHTSNFSSRFGEVNSILKEIDSLLLDSIRWNKVKLIPKFIIRSHCHKSCGVEIPMENVNCKNEKYNKSIVGITTPCWQAKTPYIYKLAIGKNQRSHIGGTILYEKNNEVGYKNFVRYI
ncbi:MAG: hypothetical protein QW727_04590 [Candidatus Pacearchaeota archaeon]